MTLIERGTPPEKNDSDLQMRTLVNLHELAAMGGCMRIFIRDDLVGPAIRLVRTEDGVCLFYENFGNVFSGKKFQIPLGTDFFNPFSVDDEHHEDLSLFAGIDHVLILNDSGGNYAYQFLEMPEELRWDMPRLPELGAREKIRETLEKAGPTPSMVAFEKSEISKDERAKVGKKKPGHERYPHAWFKLRVLIEEEERRDVEEECDVEESFEENEQVEPIPLFSNRFLIRAALFSVLVLTTLCTGTCLRMGQKVKDLGSAENTSLNLKE